MAPLKQRNTARADRPLPKVSAISGAPMLRLAGAATVLWTAASSLLAPRLLPLPLAPKSQIPHWPFKSKAQRLYKKTKPCRCKATQKQTTLVPQFFARVKFICRSFFWWWFASGTSLRIGKSCMQTKKQSHADRELKSYRHISSRVNRKLLSSERIKRSPSTGKCVCFAARQSPVQYTLWKLHWKERRHSYQAPLPACGTTHLIVPLVLQASAMELSWQLMSGIATNAETF